MKYFIISLMCVCTLVCNAQIIERPELHNAEFSKQRWVDKRWFHCTAVGASTLAVGFALMPADNAVRDRVVGRYGNDGVGQKFDDYIQYSPLAAQLITAMAGVKGTSDGNRWKVLVADAAAAATMALVTNGIKYAVNRERPNGSSNSFPSGHTATAFMGATLLTHEYGRVSIWIPIAAYSVATMTGVMRIMNNKHYVSDVVVGAAIGILSAEFGYWVSDKCFKDKPKKFKDVTHDIY